MSKSIRTQLAAVLSQIATLTAKAEELKLLAANEIDTAAVQAGRVVEFEYGKGEGKRILVGVVVGRKDPAAGEKGGSLVKVAVGEGFDSQVVTIYPQQVKAFKDEAANAEQAAESTATDSIDPNTAI